MTTLTVVTPSYRPDLELCRDLSLSLQRFGPPNVTHCVIVPAADRRAFDCIGEVHTADEYLPGNFLSVPGNMWINLRRPYPPVRGWIIQQLIKIEAAARSQADVVLLVDSDIVFVRPFSVDMFCRDRQTRFYRAVDAIHAGLPRHILWHRVARKLLGLPAFDRIPLHDYICWPMAWDPKIVRSMLRRVEETTGRQWQSAIAAQLHFSEGILYGVYVDEVLGGVPSSVDTMPCANCYDEVALDDAAFETFMSKVTPTDIAVMISAKSGTTLSTRRRLLAAIGGQTGSPRSSRAEQPDESCQVPRDTNLR